MTCLPSNLLLPTLSLVAHAAEHRRPQGIMSDPSAEAWFDVLVSTYSGIPNPAPELINGIITRSLIIDYAVLGFLATHRRVAITDLGCGFSTRRARLGLGQCQIESWAHVDLPSVLTVRCALGPMSGVELAIGRDLCDIEPAATRFSTRMQFTQNYLFICEGVFNHLPREKAHELIRALHETHPGATLIGTVITERALEGIQSLQDALGAPLAGWAIRSYSELIAWLKPAHIERCLLLGKVSSRLGLIRPEHGDEASGLVFQAKL